MTNASYATIADEPSEDGLTFAFAVEDERWEAAVPDLEATTVETLRSAIARLGLPAGFRTELSVTFTDDAAVRAINGEWRDKDKPTNVLSFPMADLQPGERPGPLLGDLVLAFETCEQEASAEAKPFVNHARHLLVHGLLHCLGYDHIDDDDADVMETLEISILAQFGIPDPYAIAETDPSRDNRV